MCGGGGEGEGEEKEREEDGEGEGGRGRRRGRKREKEREEDNNSNSVVARSSNPLPPSHLLSDVLPKSLEDKGSVVQYHLPHVLVWLVASAMETTGCLLDFASAWGGLGMC